MAVKPSVGVVGAGIAGMAACKELKDLGITADVYEMMPVIGGVFAHYGWKDGKLTSSSVFTWFSDFPIEERQKHLGWTEWLEYLNKYVDHNGIRDQFNFNCKVTSIVKNPSGGWDFTAHQKNWSNGHWTHPESNEVEEKMITKHYDYIVMGSGLHHKPSVPNWQGADGFKAAGGTLIHSSEFRKADDYVGQNVIVAGAGESGSDIAWLTSKKCKQMTISMRSPPGTLFPHNVNGNTADIRDNRLIYSIPRPTWPCLVDGHRRFYNNIKHEDNAARQKAFKFAADQNYENRNCILTINACKSFGVPKAVSFSGATIKPKICHFEGRDVYFTDGSVVKDVDAVVAATGFKVKIDALEDKNIEKKYFHPRYLWNNMVSTDEKGLFLIGFCRPHQINLITCCEMQARVMAQIVSGNKSFPSDEEMKADIYKTVEHMAHTFDRGYKALVDFIPFNDKMAKFIGCEPNFVKYFFTDFMMWVHMVFGPFQPSQYRLVGPGANYEQAREAIFKTPYYKWAGERLKRDMNMFWLLMYGGFCGALRVGGKHMRVQGQLRPLFEIFAMVYLAVMAISGSYGYKYVSYTMAFLLAVLFKVGDTMCSTDMLEPCVKITKNLSNPTCDKGGKCAADE